MLAANWKMNQSMETIPAYFEELQKYLTVPLKEVCQKIDLWYYVPYLFVERVKQAADSYGIQVGVQEIHWADKGAYTGCISGEMVCEAGIKGTLVAHSERRQYFNESNETSHLRMLACERTGLAPVLCVGETLEERSSKQTFRVIEDQLIAAFKDNLLIHHCAIAYEPVWAIGTGLSASAKQAQEVHEFIKQTLNQKIGYPKSNLPRVLYGGSMNAGNIQDLVAQKDIDGGLVGGASLKPQDYAKMIMTILNH